MPLLDRSKRLCFPYQPRQLGRLLGLSCVPRVVTTRSQSYLRLQDSASSTFSFARLRFSPNFPQKYYVVAARETSIQAPVSLSHYPYVPFHTNINIQLLASEELPTTFPPTNTGLLLLKL